MLIGYVRVSKSDGSQKLDLQKDALIKEGVDPGRIYQDYASGAKDFRPGFEACLKALQPGNKLVIWKLDRLGRSTSKLLTLLEEFNKKGIYLKILTGIVAGVDTSTPTGKLILGLGALLAENERDLIIERTRAGLAAARARGRKGGRPRKMDAQTLRMAMTAMADPANQVIDVAKRLSMTPTTLYYYLNGDGSLKAAGVKLLNADKNVNLLTNMGS